jgi:threonine dehydrogenase-like Zn-dependent dehydrogenase
MRALTFRGRKSVALEHVDDPRLESPGDALLRVRLTAVCGSDLHVYHERERGLDPGTVMGHECTGEVLETGAEVHGLRPGDRVLCPFTTSCGSCFHCREGLTARCERGQLFGWVREGVGLHGAQAEYLRVPLAATTLVRVPEGVEEEVALLLGDVLATGFYCAKLGTVRPGSVCAVVGCGPVGLMAIVGAGELGARTIFAIDGVAERRALAARFGARAVDPRDAPPAAAVREATGGRGVDAVLEAVGSADAMRLAYELVRPGGVIAAVGVHTEERLPFSPVEAYDKNLTLRVGRCPARALADELLPLVRSRRHDLAAIITHRLPLERGPEAYDLFDRRADGCIKAILRP